MLYKRFMDLKMEAAGIAPASQIPQVVTPHGTCVERGCRWLHYVCTEEALHELIANWHRLTSDVRAAIMQSVRGRGEPCASDGGPAAATSADLINAGRDNSI